MKAIEKRADRLRACTVVWVLAPVLAIVGCDRLFLYRPQQWQPVSSSTTRWSTSVGDVFIQHSGIGELTGSHGVMPEFEIRNMSRSSFVLQSAELVTATGRHNGGLPQIDGKDVPEARMVKAGATRRIAILWQFSKHAMDVLGSNPQIILEYRLDDRMQRLVIDYERVS